MLQAILETLIYLNNNFGYGDVLGIVMDEDWKGGFLTVKRTSCKPNQRRFGVNLADHTVHFAAHQKKWD